MHNSKGKSSNLYFQALSSSIHGPGFDKLQRKFSLALNLAILLLEVNTHWNQMNQQNTYIVYLDTEFLAIGLRFYANYSIDLQAIIDFPTESYSVGNLIHSEVIRTMANCMQSEIYTDPTATIGVIYFGKMSTRPNHGRIEILFGVLSS